MIWASISSKGNIRQFASSEWLEGKLGNDWPRRDAKFESSIGRRRHALKSWTEPIPTLLSSLWTMNSRCGNPSIGPVRFGG
jgi:hypothetical protein